MDSSQGVGKVQYLFGFYQHCREPKVTSNEIEAQQVTLELAMDKSKVSISQTDTSYVTIESSLHPTLQYYTSYSLPIIRHSGGGVMILDSLVGSSYSAVASHDANLLVYKFNASAQHHASLRKRKSEV